MVGATKASEVIFSRVDRRKDRVWVETRMIEDDVLRATRERRNEIDTAPVRERRRMQHAVVGTEAIDVSEAIDRHRDQTSMRQHRALGPAGRA